jgi:hypothetical protein
MSTTKNINGTELKEKLLSGIEKLNLAVSSTLGPGGRTVLIREQNGEVKVTKDGVTVAKAFHKLEDVNNPNISKLLLYILFMIYLLFDPSFILSNVLSGLIKPQPCSSLK